MFLFCYFSQLLRIVRVPSTTSMWQSTGVTVRESKPMHLLQFSQSIDSPSEIYVAFQWDPLLWPSLPPRQEGHNWHKSVGPDAEWSLLMHLRFQEPHPSPRKDNQPRPQWNTTHQTQITSIARSPSCSFLFFFFILSSTASVNLQSKCSEQNGKKKKKKIGEEL